MPDKQTDPPLRGDAAWKAQKQAIAERNEAAYKRGREQRADSDAQAESNRRTAERKDAAELPQQPTPIE